MMGSHATAPTRDMLQHRRRLSHATDRRTGVARLTVVHHCVSAKAVPRGSA
jgi:hypothetical protein